MAKVGIITIIDNDNYGNRLQNYALQETLKRNGYDVETVKNNRFYNSNVSIKKQVRYCARDIKQKIKYMIEVKKGRKKCFNNFNKNVQFSRKSISAYNSNSASMYDFFIVGSDQVWKPTGLRLSDVSLLKFANNNQKISYAASFGVSEIPESVEDIRKLDFNSFKSISVRENQGKDIIEKMTNRKDVKVLLDPTLLLSEEEWNKVIVEPKQINNLKSKKYILNYFLGELSQNRKDEINRIAKENNCDIINILDKNSPFYETGPSEFLYLEKNAFLICTDSFHSCVFSIIFNKPFVVFEREGSKINMNSRIETLLEKFNLKNRVFDKKMPENIMKCNYSGIEKILHEEQEKSEEYLNNALKVED